MGEPSFWEVLEQEASIEAIRQHLEIVRKEQARMAKLATRFEAILARRLQAEEAASHG